MVLSTFSRWQMGKVRVKASCLVMAILQVLQELPHLLDPAPRAGGGARSCCWLMQLKAFIFPPFDNQSQVSPCGLLGVLEVCV